jgi:hypothetical protein
MRSNWEGSHWINEWEDGNFYISSVKKKTKSTCRLLKESCGGLKDLRCRDKEKAYYTFGFLSLSNSIALQPCIRKLGLRNIVKKQ